MNRSQFQKFALGLLFYTVLVIVWGAWVRISHSGDGCGDTWPLCHGQLIPEAERGKTWVEYTHRLMSGLYGLIVIYFYFVAHKLYPKGAFAKKAALFSLIFMITEAALGAKLVLFKLVASNDTPYRAFVMALHQVNSFLLTGAIALTYVSSLSEDHKPAQNKSAWYVSYFPLIIIAIGITGAWASLSNSLFPSDTLLGGLKEDLATNSHFLIRLRIYHPLVALICGGSLSLFFWMKSQSAKSFMLQRRSFQMSVLLLCGILFGIATLMFHAPVWMKLAHLTLAHTIWVTLLLWVYHFRRDA
jgi:cytochrome c oxidase assembly protein subunit 15